MAPLVDGRQFAPGGLWSLSGPCRAARNCCARSCHFGDTYYAVDVKTEGGAFEAGIPKAMFEATAVSSIPTGGSPFAVTRDGRRFLVLAEVAKPTSEPLEVLLNWR